MKKVKKWRYYCDFCKKAGTYGPPMAKHEKNCTMNPGRGCGMCDRLDNSFPEPIETLMAPLKELEALRLKQTKTTTIGDLEIEGSPRLVDETKAAIDKLRKLSGHCPACMLAAVRQSKADVEFFDYKAEVKNKFKKGGRITSVFQLETAIKHGQWIYLHDTPKHPSWIAHMTFKTVMSLLDCRPTGLYFAVPNEKETIWTRSIG